MMTDSKLNAFKTPGNGKFKFLNKFFVEKLCTDAGVPICNVKISLTAAAVGESFSLGVTFIGVTDLKVGDLNGLLASMIDISDISSWRLEGVRYKVVDVEAACFSLNCQDFEVCLNASA